VKCDGLLPCAHCIKHRLVCIFTPKPIKTSPVEAKLKKMGKVLEQLSILLDPKEPTNKTTPANEVLEEIKPRQEIYNTEPIQAHLLALYFDYIDPLLPILHKPSFYSQIENGYPVSSLLLNAIYCVSSRWDMNIPTTGEPRGWNYYQKAMCLLEDQNESQLSTVQALLLLLKYNEHIRRPGFLWRTRYYFQMVVCMSKNLGLEHHVSMEAVSPEYAIELEKRKRTFWAAYCYDVMMSIEYGTQFHLIKGKEKVEDPQPLYEEDQKKIIHFILLTKIVCCQEKITEFLRRKLDPQLTVTNYLTEWNEQEALSELTQQLKKSIALVFSLTCFPQQNNMSYAVCFLSLACYYAIITLHRPLAFKDTDESETHTQYCKEAAFNIQRIMHIVLESEATEDMYCSIRGIPQILHYLSAAMTVFKETGDQNELNTLLPIVYRLASISPVTEMPKSDSNTFYDGMQNFDFQNSQPYIPPANTSFMNLLYN
ncbi:hypothetical protein CU098_006092, partial [Rhizopus stolonifer]